MKAHIYTFVTFFILSLPITSTMAANQITHPMSVGWQFNQAWFTQQTQHFILHAPEELIQHLPHVAALAEQAHLEISEALDWSPTNKTHLVLTDDVDGANGWATVYPFNQNRIYISAPDSINSLEDYRDWLSLLIRHEYTHTLHLDQARGLPAALRSVFGRQIFSFPHNFQPLWLIEGLAIDQETDHELAVGRAQSDYYAMQMRAEVERGLISLGRVSGLNRDWPQGQAYLYGAYFYEFLRQTYGEDAQADWLKSYSYNLIPYWMNPTARRVLGDDFPQVWARYQAWLSERYSPVLTPVEPKRILTQHGGSPYYGQVHQNALYRVEADGHSRPRLVKQPLTESEASPEFLTEVDYPGVFSVSPTGRIIMTQLRPNRQNRVYADLWLWDQTRWQRITQQQRYRQAVWLNEHQLLARRQVGGISELHLLSDKGQLQQVIWQGEPQTVLGHIDAHPSGQKIVAMKKPALGSWQLAEFDLNTLQWRWLTQNRFNQADPSYAVDGESVVYSANYSSAYQIYQMDTKTRHIQALTQGQVGAFNPLLTQEASLVYQDYSAEGYNWALITPKNQAKQQKDLPNIDKQAWLDSMAAPTATDLSEIQPYQPYSSLRPRAWWPILSLTEQRNQVGVMLDGQDALARHHYQLSLVYDDLAAQPFGLLSYQMDNRYLLQYMRSWREGYNPQKKDELVLLRAKDTLVAGRLNALNFFDDQLAFHLGLVFEQEKDAWRDERVTPLPTTQRTDLSLVTHWDNTQTYRYSISPASGWQGYGALDSHDGVKNDFSGYRLQFDLKHYWHIMNSQVLHTRLVGGYAQPTAHPFQLGSDRGAFSSGLFARTDYPLRGYPKASISTDKFALAAIEYRMPLARVQQNWQVYPLGLRDIYGQVFVDQAQIADRNYTGLGAQITLESVIGYRMLLPLNLGVAKGLDKTYGRTQFWLSTELAF
ncbi:hypothetical protein JX580_07340 [Thiomicrospira microaerophila]|uniref:hypothetical protein n=1 Tax=Thiomicrospira microaerophila TaxID=406020 RepID=UPI00200CD67A|nr:hypothetical protein [Thiomicrospira microaerophila]UQB41498.1 hypothetical protein JX580_07340 [Thiomicrospira microaerophila]